MGLVQTHASVLRRYLRPAPSSPSSATSNNQHTESWALVTGATDGIGLCIADELAASGFNVILHGRNPQKLDGIIEKMGQKYPNRKLRPLVIEATGRDLGPRIDAALEELKKGLDGEETGHKSMRINVLINNIGGHGGTRTWTSMAERPHEEIDTIIDVNVGFVTHMTRSVLPMLEQNSPSLIINVSSIAGNLPAAFNTIYSAGKEYIRSWSRSLKAELYARRSDVKVVTVLVGTVATASAGASVKEGFFIPSPTKAAKAILSRIGSNKTTVTAYWPHALQMWSVSLMPEWLLVRIYLKSIIPMVEAEQRKFKPVDAASDSS